MAQRTSSLKRCFFFGLRECYELKQNQWSDVVRRSSKKQTKSLKEMNDLFTKQMDRREEHEFIEWKEFISMLVLVFTGETQEVDHILCNLDLT